MLQLVLVKGFRSEELIITQFLYLALGNLVFLKWIVGGRWERVKHILGKNVIELKSSKVVLVKFRIFLNVY